MDPKTSLTYLSTAVFVTSVFLFALTIIKFPQELTGFATETGRANLTIEAFTLVNFTTDQINWSSGRVDVGQQNATLDTSGAGSVTNGNWTADTGLILENIGNVNVTLEMATGQDADAFVGGTSPLYQWNFTEVDSGSCAENITLGEYVDVNTTGSGSLICDIFDYADSNDSVRVDILLVIPSNSKTGYLSDVITATATAI